MVKRFEDNPTAAARALQIWLLLIGKAANRQTMTYGTLADSMGYKGAGTLANLLSHVMYYCRQNGLPPLTVLVVNQQTGLPGEGLTGTDLNAGREAVFNFDWYAIVPPTVEQFATAYESEE